MLLGQELKFKNKLCNLKLGTFFSALPGLGTFALIGRMDISLVKQTALYLWLCASELIINNFSAETIINCGK